MTLPRDRKFLVMGGLAETGLLLEAREPGGVGGGWVVRSENQDLERAREINEACGAPADLANSI